MSANWSVKVLEDHKHANSSRKNYGVKAKILSTAVAPETQIIIMLILADSLSMTDQ